MNIEIYNLKGFKNFIDLREECRINKNNKNWICPDDILRTKKFCNIDRKYDKGTINLYQALKNKKIEYQIITILTYRMFSSANLIIDIIKRNNNLVDFKNDFLQMTKFSNRGMPYQFVPYKKDVNFKTFFRDYIYKNHKNIIKTILNMKSVNFLNAIDLIYESIEFEKKLKFGIFQATLDIAELFPELIDPQTEPLYGIGSLNCLKEILKNEQEYSTFNELIEISKKYVNNSLTVLEHGLCEYDKYSKYRLGIKDMNSKHSQYVQVSSSLKLF